MGDFSLSYLKIRSRTFCETRSIIFKFILFYFIFSSTWFIFLNRKLLYGFYKRSLYVDCSSDEDADEDKDASSA